MPSFIDVMGAGPANMPDSDVFSKARAAPRRRNIKVPKDELLARIERLEAARRLIDQELRQLTLAYITPRT